MSKTITFTETEYESLKNVLTYLLNDEHTAGNKITKDLVKVVRVVFDNEEESEDDSEDDSEDSENTCDFNEQGCIHEGVLTCDNCKRKGCGECCEFTTACNCCHFDFCAYCAETIEAQVPVKCSACQEHCTTKCHEGCDCSCSDQEDD